MDGKLMRVIFQEEVFEAQFLEIRNVCPTDFLQDWLENPADVPAGLFCFQDEYGLYIGIDNLTGSGRFQAFDSCEVCVEWLREVKRNEQRMRKRSGMEIANSAGEGFDGEWFNSNPTVGSQSVLLQVCRSHDWLNDCEVDDLTRIAMANDSGWPIEHLATMIWSFTDYRESFEEEIRFKYAGMQRKEILRVLTQVQSRIIYESKIREKLRERE